MKRKTVNAKGELNLDLEPVAGKFAMAVRDGAAREIACFGTPGDGKTFAALVAMIMHAVNHKAAGYPLPVPWMGATDTHRSHKLKTVRSLTHRAWGGVWKLYDSNRVAVARQGSTDLVHLDLFSVEDREATNRQRMETCGVWFEEPAPASVLVTSAGIDDTAWSVALTSQRIPSHCKLAMMSLNYPYEDHWSWVRFMPGAGTSGFHPDHSDRAWFRIPPGERASTEDRAAWQRALAERPDLLRRLLEGQPGSIMMGQQVAQGFNQDIHVSRDRLSPIPNEPPYMAQDSDSLRQQ